MTPKILRRLRDWVMSETGEELTTNECWEAVLAIEEFAKRTGTVPEFRRDEER